MTRSPSFAEQRASTGERWARQIYVTHCLKSDSVEGQAGLSIRATSVHEPALYKFALDFPSYKIPLDMVAAQPSPQQAPRRLALVHAPGGKRALVHSSYVARDTMGRGGNFFSHFLIYDQITPREALRSWGSPQWQQEYPEGASQELETFAGVPDEGVLADETLTAFLASTEPPAEHDLATATYPSRVHSDAERRRHWLRAALQGFLLTRQARGSGRCRLYILAEPGVVALLLYGIARLLPPRLVDDLTFSTYEPAHGSLREFRDAQVIGTYTSNPLRGLEADYLTRLGYGIDTFRNVLSHEIEQADSTVWDALIRLAAEGDWNAIDELHELWAQDPRPSAEALGEALRIQPAFRALQGGEASVDGLLSVQKSPVGHRLLQRPDLQARAWPLVRAALSRPDVAQAFSWLVREPGRVRALKAEWVHLLAEGKTAEWKALWDATRRVFVHDELLAHFAAIVHELEPAPGATPPPLATRLALLREAQTLEPDAPELDSQRAWLLSARQADELDTLAHASLPDLWVGQACCAALLGDLAEPAAAWLRQADEPVLRGFCAAVSTRADALEILSRLLATATPETAAATFGKIVQTGLNVPPPVLEAVLTRLDADQPAWDACWKPAGARGAEAFIAVVSRLEPASPVAARLWTRFAQRLNDDLLLRRRDQRELEEFLESARARLPERVPPEVAATLDDWLLLARHFRTPLEGQASELWAACQRRGIASPVAVLARGFQHQVHAAKGKPLAEESLQLLLRCLRGFYPDEAQALPAWIEVVSHATDPRSVAEYQAAFLRSSEHRDGWRTLAQQLHGKGLAPEVEKQMMRLSAPAAAAHAATPKAGSEAGGRATGRMPGWSNLVLAAAAAVLFVAAVGMAWLWQRAEAHRADLATEHQRAQAEVRDANARLREATRALDAAKQERQQVEAALSTAQQEFEAEKQRLVAATNAIGKRLTSARDERDRIRGQAAEELARARLALYETCVAVAERELVLGHRQRARELLLAYQEAARQSAAIASSDAAQAGTNPTAGPGWEWRALLRMSEGKSPVEHLVRDANSMAVVRVGGTPAIAWSTVNTVQVWDPAGTTDQPLTMERIPVKATATPQALRGVRQLLAYANGLSLALVHSGAVNFWSVGENQERGTKVNVPGLDVRQAAVSFDGKRIAAAGKSVLQAPGSGSVRIFTDVTHEEAAPQTSDEITALAFDREGRRLAIGTASGKVEFWELAPQGAPASPIAPETTARQEAITDLALSSDGSRLVVAREGGWVDVWDVNPARKVCVLQHSAPAQAVRVVALSPDGRWIASGSADGTVKIWGASGRECLTLLHGQPVTALAFTPDGRGVVSLGEPDTEYNPPKAHIKIWDLSPDPDSDPGSAGKPATPAPAAAGSDARKTDSAERAGPSRPPAAPAPPASTRSAEARTPKAQDTPRP